MHASANVQKILLCNKVDKESDRIITKEQGEEIAKQYNMQLFETSAHTGQGIKEAFETISRNVIAGLEKDQAQKEGGIARGTAGGPQGSNN